MQIHCTTTGKNQSLPFSTDPGRALCLSQLRILEVLPMTRQIHCNSTQDMGAHHSQEPKTQQQGQGSLWSPPSPPKHMCPQLRGSLQAQVPLFLYDRSGRRTEDVQTGSSKSLLPPCPRSSSHCPSPELHPTQAGSREHVAH